MFIDTFKICYLDVSNIYSGLLSCTLLIALNNLEMYINIYLLKFSSRRLISLKSLLIFSKKILQTYFRYLF